MYPHRGAETAGLDYGVSLILMWVSRIAIWNFKLRSFWMRADTSGNMVMTSVSALFERTAIHKLGKSGDSGVLRSLRCRGHSIQHASRSWPAGGLGAPRLK